MEGKARCMKPASDKGLLKKIKRRLRGLQKELHVGFVRRFRSYDGADLSRALARCGVRANDQLMLHASFDERSGFRGTVTQALDAFVHTVDAGGALYMVSMPYTGSTLDYLAGTPVFDVRRTPSRMGLMSEMLRRRSGVVRSRHPTHPILGLGAPASAMLMGHETCMYPCGPGSPFERLLAADAKVAFLDASMSTMTYYHYLEHLVSPDLPFRIYPEHPEKIQHRLEDGTIGWVEVLPFTTDSIRRRRPEILQGWMRDANIIRRARVGASELIVIGLRDVTQLVLERARRGQFFYEMSP